MALLYSWSVITLPHFVWLGSSSSGFVMHSAWKDLRSSIPCRLNWEYEVFFWSFVGLVAQWNILGFYRNQIILKCIRRQKPSTKPLHLRRPQIWISFVWKGLCSGSTFDGRRIEWPDANYSQIHRLHKLCMHRHQTQIWIVSIHIKALQRKPISRQFNSNHLREFLILNTLNLERPLQHHNTT